MDRAQRDGHFAFFGQLFLGQKLQAVYSSLQGLERLTRVGGWVMPPWNYHSAVEVKTNY
jgi:hypothetical protein